MCDCVRRVITSLRHAENHTRRCATCKVLHLRSLKPSDPVDDARCGFCWSKTTIPPRPTSAERCNIDQKKVCRVETNIMLKTKAVEVRTRHFLADRNMCAEGVTLMQGRPVIAHVGVNGGALGMSALQRDC
nr:hypothetical protein CFP56_72730 [Quercus suber]